LRLGAVMKSRISLAGAVVLLACQAARGSSAEGAQRSSVEVPAADWDRFISELDASLDRIVPEVNADRLTAIRYFYVRVAPAERIGIVSGDRFVAVNGVKVDRPRTADAKLFLHDEMKRSVGSCELSFTIASASTTRTVGAHCDH
jgi:hypothetical protein